MLRTHFDLELHLERLASFQLRSLAGAWVTATQDGEFGQAPDATPMGRLDETIVGTITTSDERIGAIFLDDDAVASVGPLRLHKLELPSRISPWHHPASCPSSYSTVYSFVSLGIGRLREQCSFALAKSRAG
jgi:hypothetical protein